ncbi:MAG: lasso RiPP family leader peptide-containing protein [Solirubrobacteraceae bacterium]
MSETGAAEDRGSALAHAPTAKPGRDGASAAYEAPRLTDLGTFVELTAGTNPTATDGFGPGSVLT